MLANGSLLAQDRIISGKVTDAKTGLPLSSCSVYAMHSGNGVITDENGNYTFTVPGRIDSIAISMIGYTPIIKPLSKEKEQVVNFNVETASGSIQEVAISVKSKYTKA